MKKKLDTPEQSSARTSLTNTYRSNLTRSIISRRSSSISQKPKNSRLRTKSDQTDSSSTFKDHKHISQSLNTHKLELSLRGIYDKDPVPRLDKIFREAQVTSKNFYVSTRSRKKNVKNMRRKSMKNDSIFVDDEAELIRQELNSIKSPKVWQELVRNFKQNPGTLMELIPVE